MSDITSLAVEHLCSLEYATASSTPTFIAGGPAGTRVVVAATSGTFTGPRLRGEVVPPGGDWVTVAPNGTMRLDVRALWRTDDGADILVTYTGVGVDRGSGLELHAAPRFETGDPRYAWLNDVQAIAIGRMGGAGVVYDVYALSGQQD